MRVLVTGAAGQLGHDLMDVLAGRLPVGADPDFAAGRLPSGVEALGLDRRACDLTDEVAVSNCVEAFRPDLIIHAAAYTAVDRAEDEPELAMTVNRDGSAHVARAAARVGAHLVAVSTDYVFDGTATEPYLEEAPTNPLSVYGATKLAGELACGPSATIARTSWVVGSHGHNIVKTILQLADKGTAMTFVDDQHGCPTLSPDLAVALVALGMQREPGIVHVTNSGATTWFSLARAVLEAAGHDPEMVQPIATKDRLPAPKATRPMFSVLDGQRLVDRGIGPLPAQSAAIRSLVMLLRGQPGGSA